MTQTKCNAEEVVVVVFREEKLKEPSLLHEVATLGDAQCLEVLLHHIPNARYLCRIQNVQKLLQELLWYKPETSQ